MSPYTFVTVVYEAEIALHRLQAQSMARYLPRGLVGRIVVIENATMSPEWRGGLRQHYGPLAPAVMIIPAERIASIPPSGGWLSQQILKLMVSRHVATERYVILDAKNHLVFPLEAGHLERNGRMLSFMQHYDTHPLRSRLERAARYFAIKPSIARFPPTTTPYIVPTRMVLRLIQYIQAHEGNFEQFFLRSESTEFLLFAAFLAATDSLDSWYDFSGTNYSIIWKDTAVEDVIRREIENTERYQRPFFAVHRRAIPVLSSASQQLIAEFWQRRGLFPSIDEALHAL
jgi:hypothetical protein